MMAAHFFDKSCVMASSMKRVYYVSPINQAYPLYCNEARNCSDGREKYVKAVIVVIWHRRQHNLKIAAI